ncbi:P-loop containing nucleoside triphosphate hydrolase protein [Armillaria novae-zelandiae]|uniref:P-loop containing nucleoside triphosphate hydrolase protein n=1 Tax=Armillaria novae-zelandiae TaxID=153914 RepID=A0AA39P2F2_9AGAR|nr:P-loop containing nucleoside triphosphate hydrolase protein [Armillaria novae-zelandiae]
MSGLFRRRPARQGTTNGDRTANDIPNNTHIPLTGDSSSLDSDSEQDSAVVPINQTEYAQRCREVMELYRALQDLGAGSLLTTLPKIIVIGGQSTGKSSLVEAVSGINVPRDSGTCTRCPMECTMLSSSSTWSCTIYLNVKYGSDGSELVTSNKIQFGPVITDKDAVEVWIRRAQAAILCQHRPKEDFMSMGTADLRNLATRDSQMLSFSRNIVQVELRDPDLTDLSFIDLPGIIHNAEEETITLVRDLVVSYIEESENTIVLITIPMSDDIEMQAAVKLTKSKDPSGDRTIGVLTKPDMLTTGASGARDKWREIILGQDQRHKLKHGYYCVRLPDDDERKRNISRDKSQMAAQQFFERTSPWREFTDRSRFGIPALVRDISRLLVGLIENYIPTLKESVDNLLTRDKAEFSALPPPPPIDQAWTQIIILIDHFCGDVKAAVEGKEEHKKLVQSNRARYEQLKRDILSTCPDFRPFDDKTRYRDPCIEDEVFERKANPHVRNATSNPVMDIKDVRREIQSCISWELPGEVPYETTLKLIDRFTKKWPSPSEECFNDVYRASSAYIQKLVAQHFGQFKLLEMHIGELVRSQMEIYKKEALVTLHKAVKLDTSPKFTQVPHYLMERSKWLEQFHKVYNTSGTYLLRSSPSEPRLAGVAYYTVRETAEDEEALVVMAKVRTYFEVAYKRFIDNVPLTIEHELHQSLSDRLFQSLIKDMGGPNAHERARELFREDPVIASRRSVLQERIARLEEIRGRLYSFR